MNTIVLTDADFYPVIQPILEILDAILWSAIAIVVAVGTIEVYKDGKKIDYELVQELKEYGNYEVVVTDKLGNSRTYNFTLEFQMNGWAITLIVLGLATLVGLTATIVMKRKRLFKK